MLGFFHLLPGANSVSVTQLKGAIDSRDIGTLIDVRTPQEYQSGHIANSILIPEEEVAAKIQSLVPDLVTKIYVYCHSGNRSAKAVGVLRSMDYSDSFSVRGGIAAWIKKGYPVEK